MKNCFIIFIFCLFTSKVQAQISLGYSIGSIGGGGMKTIAASNSLLISGQNCFNVSNSISTLKIPNRGDFNQNCQINYATTPFKINLNPNPVDRITVVQLMDKILNDNQFRLTLFTNSGQALFAIDVVQDQLLAGYRIDLSNVTAGYYYLQVASQKVLKSIKILKN